MYFMALGAAAAPKQVASRGFQDVADDGLIPASTI